MIAGCACLFAGGLWLILLPLLRSLSSPHNYYFDRLGSLRPLTAFGRRLKRWREELVLRAADPALERLVLLAGSPFGLNAVRLQAVRLMFLIMTAGFIVAYFFTRSGSLKLYQFPFLTCGICGAAAWLGPYLVVLLAARKRKSKLLLEISRLSQRLSVCISGKTDLRDTLLRAGRTSLELKPYLSELAAVWNKDQTRAITTFGERIGISEVYPLVNTLMAASQVDASEVAEMLERQVESIDKTLEHEVARKLENAPLGIIFLIMIPFMVVFALMVFPWMHEMSKLLLQAF